MNILIRMPNWIGDAVMATPALKNLQKHFDKSNFYLITSPAVGGLFTHDPSIKKVYIDNSKKGVNRYKALKELAQTIETETPTIHFGFTFQNNFPSALLLKMSGVQTRYGISNGLRNALLTKAIKVDKTQHQAEIYNQLVNNSLDTNYTTGRTTLHVTAKRESEKKRVGINPGATYGSAKRWEPHKFSEVALHLSKDYEIVILGTENESDIANKIESVLKFNGVTHYKNLAGKTSIYELMQEISTCDLFITNDSGPMHVAGAFQVPTVTIFGSTNHIQTNQWKNKKSKIVRVKMDCAPCMKRTCPLKHHNCMKQVTADMVMKAISELSLDKERSKAVFLDRDGVINVEKEYLHKKEDFEFINGVIRAMKEFNAKGYEIFIITNQSGIGRGYYTEEQYKDLTNWMVDELQNEGVSISGIKHCPHTPEDKCDCRKPSPKMIFDLEEEFSLDLRNSWFIGDKESDIESARAAKIPNTILVRSGHKIDEENTKAKFIRNSAFDTIDLIK